MEDGQAVALTSGHVEVLSVRRNGQSADTRDTADPVEALPELLHRNLEQPVTVLAVDQNGAVVSRGQVEVAAVRAEADGADPSGRIDGLDCPARAACEPEQLAASGRIASGGVESLAVRAHRNGGHIHTRQKDGLQEIESIGGRVKPDQATVEARVQGLPIRADGQGTQGAVARDVPARHEPVDAGWIPAEDPDAVVLGGGGIAGRGHVNTGRAHGHGKRAFQPRRSFEALGEGLEHREAVRVHNDQGVSVRIHADEPVSLRGDRHGLEAGKDVLRGGRADLPEDHIALAGSRVSDDHVVDAVPVDIAY